MSRNKLIRFAEMANFSNVLQPDIKSFTTINFSLKGNWKTDYFKNNYPITLELGCGKGEYTVSLGKLFPLKNFIGIDIKGARIYLGAKYAMENNLYNVAFLRTKIELLKYIFSENEIDEIWLTFPDPQPKKRWTKKRLTSSYFQNKYLRILKQQGILHLKTDSKFLYHYTLSLLKTNNVNILYHSEDIHNNNYNKQELKILTYYEQQFIEKGEKITYICWEKPEKELKELSDETFEEIKEQYFGPNL